ncbi:MAG: hypothetical protein ACOYL6_00750 [Bacteriovoracaceae bacterium]
MRLLLVFTFIHAFSSYSAESSNFLEQEHGDWALVKIEESLNLFETLALPENRCNERVYSPIEQSEATVCLTVAYSGSKCKPYKVSCEWDWLDLQLLEIYKKFLGPIEGKNPGMDVEMSEFKTISANESVQSSGFGPCYAISFMNFACQRANLAHLTAKTDPDKAITTLTNSLANRPECKESKDVDQVFMLLSKESYQSLDDLEYRRIICETRKRYPTVPIVVALSPKQLYEYDAVKVDSLSSGFEVTLEWFDGEISTDKTKKNRKPHKFRFVKP